MHEEFLLDWRLRKGQDIIELPCMPFVYSFQRQQHLDCILRCHRCVRFGVMHPFFHFGSIDIEARFILLDFSSLDVAFSLHLPHSREYNDSLWDCRFLDDGKVSVFGLVFYTSFLIASTNCFLSCSFMAWCGYIVSGSDVAFIRTPVQGGCIPFGLLKITPTITWVSLTFVRVSDAKQVT
jgi:hypothetical protein